MASVEVRSAARAEWAPANPWTWIFLGLVATLAGFLGVQVGSPATSIRFALIIPGLLSAGAAIWIRLGSPEPAFLESFPCRRRQLMLLGLTALGTLSALTITALVLLDFAGKVELPWLSMNLLWMWFVVVPWGLWLAVVTWRRGKKQGSMSRGEECAALLTLAALAAFAASWTLYFGADRVQEWDSLRLGLAVLALVSWVAAPLMVVSRGIRRFVVSALVSLHFGGILIAVLASPPAPWLVGQIWFWFYRPYLQFMYLNNAYHFYAPEPGPASYLWFRVESEDAGHKMHSHWLKIPDLDDNTGQPRYPLALQYQRMLALTENSKGYDPTPPIVEMKDGEQRYAPFFAERLRHAMFGGPVVIGRIRPEPDLIIPFHPQLSPQDQYQKPNLSGGHYLESFARFVMQHEAERIPALTPVHVKIYRVVHFIPDAMTIAAEMDPCYPTLFAPFYMGEYDRDGKMTARSLEDPFLYWLLPVIKKEPEKEDSEIWPYVFLHAGERRWRIDASDTRLKTKLKLPEDQ